jgi:tRNA-splicing ligase RtcB
MGKSNFSGPLELVDTCCYRIPKEYKAGMLVDGLIFANDKLIHQLRSDSAPEQVANVAFLPGIQQASLAMPDIHWGYGFCIGGVAATDPDEGGVITPGGIGYDINCLTADSLVRCEHGYTRPISELADAWPTTRLTCLDTAAEQLTATDAVRWFGQPPQQSVLKLTTVAGDTIEATADHPFWTPHGMRPLGSLRPDEQIAFAPFAGVPFTPPSQDEIVSAEQITAHLQQLGTGGQRIPQVLRYLQRRDLLPLRYDSPALPYLCKIVGFVLGDGVLRFVGGTGKGVTSFYGTGVDLDAIRADLARIGVVASQVYRRQREHHIHNGYANYAFVQHEEHINVVSTAFATLLACLGVPVGNKTRQSYAVPTWLSAAPQWQQRLFLAGLFGAELTTPTTMTGHGTVFTSPTLSMTKRTAHAASGRQFLTQIADLLRGFGVETQALTEEVAQRTNQAAPGVRFRLILSPKAESLHALWAKVGFVYNGKRAHRAALAVQYLKHKQRTLNERETVACRARTLAGTGVTPAAIYAELVGPTINRRFVERSIYSTRASACRVPKEFMTFADYCQSAALGTAGVVWERIASIQTSDYRGLVYDFTVAHSDHNFVANQFVVSNCGVRLVRTNLFYRDVKHHLKNLVDELFKTIPSGAGRSGKYAFSVKEMQPLLEHGAGYLLGRDLGTETDIANTESNGKIPLAEPDEVSARAVGRGAESCGTLGSGNHFLEVQVVDAVFDADVAQVFGLEKDQVCVMIHSGSRGLGYQVCDDALAMLRNVPKKYGIELPDQQLACAPVHSAEGRKYIGAMRAAANFGFCNRQLLMQQAREVFAKIFGRSWEDLGMSLLYDVAHNIAKLEEHTVGGKLRKLWVHRKGATRAFPAGHPEVPAQYRGVGQPVIIPGDMGRASWVLVGAPGSMEKTFGTTCHGAGRAMSRTAAVKEAGNRKIDQELAAKGVIARAASRKGLAEEQPKAYKNVDDVVDVVHAANLSRKVARMRPIGVIKG